MTFATWFPAAANGKITLSDGRAALRLTVGIQIKWNKKVFLPDFAGVGAGSRGSGQDRFLIRRDGSDNGCRNYPWDWVYISGSLNMETSLI